MKPISKHSRLLLVLLLIVAGLAGAMAPQTAAAADTEAPKPKGYVAGFPTAISPTIIDVMWNAATDNKTKQEEMAYRVAWKKPSEIYWHYNYPFEDFSYAQIPKNKRHYQITGLDADTKYLVAVVAVDKADNNKWDEEVEVTTLPDTEAPTPGSYLSGYPKATSPTTIELKWARGEDNVTPRNELGYRVEWKTEAETDWTWHTYSEELPWDLTEYTIPDLKPNTMYGVQVTIHDYAKNSATYGMTFITTPPVEDTEAPTPGSYLSGYPKATTSKATGKSTIELKWTRGSDDVTPQGELRYRVEWKTDDETVWNWHSYSEELPRDLTEYTIPDLKPGTMYGVQVTIHDYAKNSATYGMTFITTPPAESPQPGENDPTLKLTPEKMEVGANQQSKEVGVSCDKAFRITGIGTMSDWISNFSPTSEEVKTQHSVTFNVKANPGAERTGKLVINTTRGSLTLIVTQAAKSAEEGNKAPEPQGYVGTPVVTSSTIKLKWNPAKDDHTAQKDLRYMVAWRLPSEEEWKTSSSEVDMPKNITEYEIKGLKENTQYIVNVAVVDEAGKETRYGELKITTLPKGTKPDEPNPNPGVVSKPVISLTLDQTAVTVNGNLESFLLKAVVLPADADNPGLKWSSSNPSVASVVAVSGEAPEPSGKLLRSGPVTGRTVAVHIHSKGKAVITAQTIDGSNKSATCQVDVLATVGNMEASATRIYTSAGRLYLSLPTATPVEIYTLLGVRLRTFIAPAGDSSVTLPQGMYVVRAGRKIEKVVAN